MKRLVLITLLVALFLLPVTAFAQDKGGRMGPTAKVVPSTSYSEQAIKAGKFTISGGSYAALTGGSPDEGDSYHNFDILANCGYFISDSLEVGAEVHLGFFDYGVTDGSRLSLGPQAYYYIPISNEASAFIGGIVYLGVEDLGYMDYNYFGLKGRGGIAYFINPQIAIVGMAELGLQRNDYDGGEDALTIVYGLIGGIKLFLF